MVKAISAAEQSSAESTEASRQAIARVEEINSATREQAEIAARDFHEVIARIELINTATREAAEEMGGDAMEASAASQRSATWPTPVSRN